MRKTFWIFCGGDYGGVVAARETSVTVREIDRRVLLVHAAVEVGAHNLCVESDWPSSQTVHSSERRHVGLLYVSPTRSMTLRVLTENR